MKPRIKIKPSEIQKIKGSVEDYLEKVGKAASEIIAKDLAYEARMAMFAFYSSYTPHVYERHYYNFMSQSYKAYVDNRNGIYNGGVLLDPSFLDDLYEDSPSEVFHNVYAGYHGNPEISEKYGIPRLLPTPMERILDRKKEIINKELGVILTLAQLNV